MSKYIKLQDAIKSVADQYMFEASIENPQSCDDIKEWEKVASRVFSDIPTIDIVRCKDCKFCEKHEDYSPTPIEPPWCYCKNPWVMRETGFNDFCSYGERIESEE